VVEAHCIDLPVVARSDGPAEHRCRKGRDREDDGGDDPDEGQVAFVDRVFDLDGLLAELDSPA